MHLKQIFKYNFAGKKYTKVLYYIIMALKFRSTKYKCRDNIREVIKILKRKKDYKKINYLIKEWWDTNDTWANYACQHLTIFI